MTVFTFIHEHIYHRFCCENLFTFDQCDLLISIIREVFEKCMISNEDNGYSSASDSIELFYELMVKYTAMSHI